MKRESALTRFSLASFKPDNEDDVNGENPMHRNVTSIKKDTSARRVSHAMGIKDHSAEAENFEDHQGKIDS